jgi:hypothetical protein
LPFKPQNLRRDDRSHLMYLPESWEALVDRSSPGCRPSHFTAGFTGGANINRCPAGDSSRSICAPDATR